MALSRYFDGLRRGLLMLALDVRALPHRACLQPLLDHVRTAALGTLLLYGLAPRDELTIGVAIAAVESLALLRTPLNDFAFIALGTLDSDCLLLDVLTSRVVTARGELAEAARFQH